MTIFVRAAGIICGDFVRPSNTVQGCYVKRLVDSKLISLVYPLPLSLSLSLALSLLFSLARSESVLFVRRHAES
jgi:hypothetical protein